LEKAPLILPAQAAEYVAAFEFLADLTGVPTERMLLGGHSAGGHISSLLGLQVLDP
jgi:acetyl esterase/lipase